VIIKFIFCVCVFVEKCAKGMMKIDPNSRLITLVDLKNSKEKKKRL